MGEHVIESIVTRRLAASSINENPDFRTVTVYIGAEGLLRPTVTAQIDLSRLEGGGAAKAYIWSYEQLGRFETDPITQFVEPPLSFSDPNWIMEGASAVTFPNEYSVTFGVTVINMFAHANCSVFIYQTRSLVATLVAILSEPFRRFLGP